MFEIIANFTVLLSFGLVVRFSSEALCCTLEQGTIFSASARFFLLVDLREFFFRFRARGTKIKKS